MSTDPSTGTNDNPPGQTQSPPASDSIPIAQPAAPLELGYAPPARGGNRVVWVLLAGILTTALTLLGEYFIDRSAETFIMGWYANYVIPAGAILVGLIASSGYAIASWILGVKIRRWLLATIVALMIFSYFLAQFLEFKSRGPLGIRTGATTTMVVSGQTVSVPVLRPLGFWEHFHLTAMNWTWKKEHSSDKENEPLGMWGYCFVLLGVVGYALSGLIIPAAVGQTSYCELCERYMKSKPIALFEASMPFQKFKKNQEAEKAAYDQQHVDKFNTAVELINQLKTRSAADDLAGFAEIINNSPAKNKTTGKLPIRMQVNIVRCLSCSSGFLQPIQISGQGRDTKQVKLTRIELTPAFIRRLRDEAKI